MNIIVHLMFAVTVRRRIKKTLGFALNLPGFLYGNILPDISKKYGEHPHYMKDALTHVVNTKDYLIEQNAYEPLSPYQFAKELGAINHYLSDFFCLPHTEGYQGSKTQHGIYEFLMIARYRKGSRAFRTLLLAQGNQLELSDLKAFIIDNNKAYQDRKASKINDIRFALFAGTKLSESMLTQIAALPEAASEPLLPVSYIA